MSIIYNNDFIFTLSVLFVSNITIDETFNLSKHAELSKLSSGHCKTIE